MSAAALAWAACGWACAAAAVVAARGRFGRRLELVARARHELAGPLQAAALALEAARREAPTPRLAALDLELRRAARALEDLDAARAGRRARDEAATFDVGALLAQQALVWQPVARAHGRSLRVGAPSGLVVRGDRIRLAQAIANLLANACEHGAGRIELRAAPEGGEVRIEVLDDGGGPARAALTLTRAARGGRGARGRGLAIAGDVAARHRGRLVARPGGVGLSLPAATAPEAA